MNYMVESPYFAYSVTECQFIFGCPASLTVIHSLIPAHNILSTVSSPYFSVSLTSPLLTNYLSFIDLFHPSLFPSFFPNRDYRHRTLSIFNISSWKKTSSLLSSLTPFPFLSVVFPLFPPRSAEAFPFFEAASE